MHCVICANCVHNLYNIIYVQSKNKMYVFKIPANVK